MAGISEAKSDIWIGCGLLGLCAFAAWRTLKVKAMFASATAAGPAFVPWIMIGGIAIMSVAMIVRALRRSGVKTIDVSSGAVLGAMAGFAALLVAYAAAFFPLGYIPATLIAIFAGLLLLGERKIAVLLLFPPVMTFAVHYGFTKLLQVWLP